MNNLPNVNKDRLSNPILYGIVLILFWLVYATGQIIHNLYVLLLFILSILYSIAFNMLPSKVYVFLCVGILVVMFILFPLGYSDNVLIPISMVLVGICLLYHLIKSF